MRRSARQNVSQEEHLDLALLEDTLNITYQNLSKLEMSIYEIDLEVLFSRAPFLL